MTYTLAVIQEARRPWQSRERRLYHEIAAPFDRLRTRNDRVLKNFFNAENLTKLNCHNIFFLFIPHIF